MSTDHALFFVWNQPHEGRESNAMESFGAMKAFWGKHKDAGHVDNFEMVHLSSTRNENMPVGFLLVTGERAKLHGLRWDDEEFANLHIMTMRNFTGYACLDGYAGTAIDALMNRFAKLMTN